MKLTDFATDDNGVYEETCRMIIKAHGACSSTECAKCPFSERNSTLDKGGCSSLGYIGDSIDSCKQHDPTLVKSAEKYLDLVEKGALSVARQGMLCKAQAIIDKFLKEEFNAMEFLKLTETKETTMLTITKTKTNAENAVEKMTSDCLYQIYDFVEESYRGSIAIPSGSIKKVLKRNFTEAKNIEVILYLAENGAESCMENYNFTVYEDGEIKISCDMLKIKKNFEGIKEAYEEFKNREFFNVIEFSVD